MTDDQLNVYLSVLGKIRSAVGSAQLLMSQKFQQLYWLCQQNLVSKVIETLCVHTVCECVLKKIHDRSKVLEHLLIQGFS